MHTQSTLLQKNRELGTILAALNMWAAITPKQRANYRMVATDSNEFEPLAIDEIVKLIDRLNMGGYVSPSEVQDPELMEIRRQGELKAMREHLAYLLDSGITSLRSPQHMDEIEDSLTRCITTVGRAKHTLAAILRLEASAPK